MNPLSELRTEAIEGRALPALSSGLVSGVYMVIYVISAGSIIFFGSLAPFLSHGIGTILFGTFIVCLVIALFGGYRGAISALPSPSIVVLVAIGSTIALSGKVLFVTMIATMMVSALVAGTVFFAIGRSRSADLMRFIPYSVAGGFLAGTGGGLCVAALSLLGVTPGWPIPASMLDPPVLWKWVVGVGYGAGLFLVTNRWSNSLILPVSFVTLAALYHLGLAVLEISAHDARAMGLLFSGIAQGGLWPAFKLGELALVDWAAVAMQIPNMLALALVILLSMVMYLGALELGANVELEWNREFTVAGLGSLLAGLGGSPAGCLSTSGSIISHKLGAESRLTGVVASVAMGSTILWGDAVLMLAPVPLVAGILVFIGLVLLDGWLIRNRAAMPWTEYSIILLIFITIVGFGFLAGVGIGMAITTVFLAFRLTRVELIETTFTARERSSNKSRSVPDQAILRDEGTKAEAFCLRGYIFFGSAYPLVERINLSLRKDPPPACILLDFSAVTGIDFSAMSALGRFIRTAHGVGTRVVLSAASEQFEGLLRRDLPPPVFDTLRLEPDPDRALERCEDFIIAASTTNRERKASLGETLLDRVAGDMERHLDRQVRFEELVDALRNWLEPREYDMGQALAVIGEPQKGLQILTAGRASVYDSTGRRLFQCGPGDAVEPQGAFGSYPATRTTLADEPCRTVMLTDPVRRWLEANESDLTLKLYGYLLGVQTHDSPPAAP